MKTAMQDVLDLVQKRLNEFDGLNGFEVTMMRQELNWFKEILSNNLEKEKEQIIDAWEKGYSTGCVVGSNDYTNEDEEKDNGNYYYNQTYNQESKKEYQPSEEYLKKQRDNMEGFIWNRMNKNNQNK